MKILQICPKPPMPLVDGGCIASHRLSLDLLDNKNELKILTYATYKHPYVQESFDAPFLSGTKLEFRFVDIKVNTFQLVKNFFSNQSIQVERFKDEDFKELLFDHLGQYEYDYIILDGLMTGVYAEELKKRQKAKIIYRAHNIEHKLFDQRSMFEGTWLKRLFFKIQSKRLKKFEENIWNEVDHILSISDYDKAYIQNIVDSKKVSTYAFALESGDVRKCLHPKTLFHIGSMDWKPNLDGILWFLEKVFPKIKEKHNNVTLHLAGKNISDYKEILGKEGVHIHSDVQSASDFMNAYELMIIPLQVGSGVRIKALEAMSIGKAIVATKKGIEGLNLLDNEVAVVDDPNEMVDRISILLENEEMKSDMREKALDFVTKFHSPEMNRNKIAALFNELKSKG